MEREMLFENLDEALELDTAVISTKWLSNQFDLHIHDSERTLAAYLQARRHLSAVFVLSGFVRNDEMVVKLVPHDKLNEAAAEFGVPPAQTIYSIQRHPCQCSTTLASVDPLLDLTTEALKKFVTIPWTPGAEAKTCDSNKQKSNASLNPVQHTSSIVSTINKTGKDKQIKTKNVNNFFKPTSKSPANTKCVPHCSEDKQFCPDVMISSLSNRNDNNTSNDLATDDDDEEFGQRRSAAPRGSLIKRKRVIESDEDEYDKVPNSPQLISTKSLSPKQPALLSSNNSYTKPMKSNQIERRSKLAVPVSDPEVNPPSVKRSSLTKTATKLESPKKTCGGLRATRGGSNLQSTATIRAGISRESELPVDPKPARAHHHTLKTFMDDDGFMVTEKVWESIPLENVGNRHGKIVGDIVISEASSSGAHVEHTKSTKSETSKKIPVTAPAPKHPRTSSNSIRPLNVKQTSLSAFLKKT